MQQDFSICKSVMRAAALLIVMLFIFLGYAPEEAAAATTSVSRFTGSTYTHSSTFDQTILVDGVDVSYVQKNNVDWKKAKADGVDFAIIRVGARGYGQAGKLIEDDYYKENIKAAQDAGIMVGVYFFSQAVDPLEAYAEANYTLKLIEGFDLDLPVYMDYEFAGGTAGRLTNAQLSKIKMTENAEMFLETIEAAGYEAGFYANRNFLNNTVNGKSIGQRWDVWVAQYNTNTDYSGDYHMWQYSSSGSIDGYTGRVDVNFMYIDPAPTATSSRSIANSTISFLGSSSYNYSYGTAWKPSVRVSLYGSTLIEGIDYEVFYLKNANAGTAYALVRGKGSCTDHKLVPFTVNPSTNISGINIGAIEDKTYNGKEQKPTKLTVTDAYGNVLVKGVDYTFTVKDAKNVGTATVTVTFCGNYSGTKTVTYKILPGKQTITASTTSYTVNLADQPFQLEGITTIGDAALKYSTSDASVVTVDQNGVVTPVGPGTAYITVTAEAGNYEEARVKITVEVKKPVPAITTGSESYTKTRLASAFGLSAKTTGLSQLTFASTDESVAKVNSSGRVTVMGPGSAEIVISSAEDSYFAAAEKRVTVTVSEMSEEAYAAKYDKLKAGIEGTKVVSLKAAATVSGSKKSVKLSWKKSNSGYAVDYYQVWRSTKKSSGYSKTFTTTSGASKTYKNSKSLSEGKTYWYKVRGVRSLEGKLVYTPFTKVSVVVKK